MHDITVLLLGVGVILNSMTIAALSIKIKKIQSEKNVWFDRWVEQRSNAKKYAVITKTCYENFRNTKSMFLKLRKELIKNGVLPKEFEYVDDKEEIEEFIDHFTGNQEKKESVNSSSSSESVFSQD